MCDYMSTDALIWKYQLYVGQPVLNLSWCKFLFVQVTESGHSSGYLVIADPWTTKKR